MNTHLVGHERVVEARLERGIVDRFQIDVLNECPSLP